MMDKTQNSQANESRNSLSGFGAVLKANREEQGISLGDMEARSRLSVAQLRALEEEDLALLPEPVYVRAFIRNVAQVLRIDPAPLLADYSNRYGSGGQVGVLPTNDFSREPVLARTSNNRGLRLIGIIILLILLVAGAWYAYTDEGGLRSQLIDKVMGTNSEETVKPAHTETEAQAVAASNGEVTKPADASTSTLDLNPAPVAPAANTNAPVATTPALTTTPEANPAEVAPAAAASSAGTAANATATAQKANDDAKNAENAKPQPKVAGERQVTIQVKAKCWIEVVSPKGDVLFSREMVPGSSESLNVPTGSRFTVGNAPAASIKVDGAAYDMGPYSKNAVARFTLK